MLEALGGAYPGETGSFRRKVMGETERIDGRYRLPRN